MSLNLDGSLRNGGKIRADAITSIERDWVDLVQQQGMGSVYELLIDRGVSAASAGSIAAWLHDQAVGRRLVSNPTVSRYRKALARVGPIPGYVKSPGRAPGPRARSLAVAA